MDLTRKMKNLFLFQELKHEKDYLKIKPYKNVHSHNIEQMDFNEKDNAIISCSKDSYVSLIKTFLSKSKTPYILKMRKVKITLFIKNILKNYFLHHTLKYYSTSSC